MMIGIIEIFRAMRRDGDVIRISFATANFASAGIKDPWQNIDFSSALDARRASDPPCPPHARYAAGRKRFRGKTVEISRINAGSCHTGVVGHFITMVSTFSD
jgi:hypothetical protein